MNLANDLIENLATTEQLRNGIITCIQEKKGLDLLQLDLREFEEAATNYFIICHGESTTQVKAITDHILNHTKRELGIIANHTEGLQNATWVLIDYFDIVVHIFEPEAREFYQLEALWSDAKITQFKEE